MILIGKNEILIAIINWFFLGCTFLRRWLARGQFGKTGLVPKNYVQVVADDVGAEGGASSSIQTEFSKLHMSNGSSSSPSVISKFPHQPGVDESIKKQSWYFGCISRTQCDTILNEFADDGDFLIRDSETNVSCELCQRICLQRFVSATGWWLFCLIESTRSKQTLQGSFRGRFVLYRPTQIWVLTGTDWALQESSDLY